MAKKYEVKICADLSSGGEEEMNPFYYNDTAKVIFYERAELEYSLQSTITKEEFEKIKLESDKWFATRIVLTDHSGISFNVLDTFFDRWDSSYVGYLLIDTTKFKNGEDLLKYAKSIMNEYQIYYNGEYLEAIIYEVSTCKCCGQKIEEFIDSCCGFTSIEDIKEYAKDYCEEDAEIKFVEVY